MQLHRPCSKGGRDCSIGFEPHKAFKEEAVIHRQPARTFNNNPIHVQTVMGITHMWPHIIPRGLVPLVMAPLVTAAVLLAVLLPLLTMRLINNCSSRRKCNAAQCMGVGER